VEALVVPGQISQLMLEVLEAAAVVDQPPQLLEELVLAIHIQEQLVPHQ
jgi:hypothetical protein